MDMKESKQAGVIEKEELRSNFDWRKMALKGNEFEGGMFSAKWIKGSESNPWFSLFIRNGSLVCSSITVIWNRDGDGVGTVAPLNTSAEIAALPYWLPWKWPSVQRRKCTQLEISLWACFQQIMLIWEAQKVLEEKNWPEGETVSVLLTQEWQDRLWQDRCWLKINTNTKPFGEM